METPNKHESLGGITLAGDRNASRLSLKRNPESFQSCISSIPQTPNQPAPEQQIASESQTEVATSPSKSLVDLENSAPSQSEDATPADKQSLDQAKDSSAPPPPDPNLITFSGPDDPLNPQNLPFARKVFITTILATLTFTTTFTSSIFSTSVSHTAHRFRISTHVTTLGTSLFLLGFTLGPIIFGPTSELYGRRAPLLIGIFLMTIFQIAVASGTTIQPLLICRFFAGGFGVAPSALSAAPSPTSGTPSSAASP